MVILYYALRDIQSGIYWRLDKSVDVRPSRFYFFHWIFVDLLFSNNGGCTNSSSRTSDQSESRTVGNSACCWYIYPTRKLEIQGFYWSIESADRILLCDDEKSMTLIAQSLQNYEDILEDEQEHEEVPKLPEGALDQSQLEQPPSGISCLISIERCSNLNIRQNSKVQVRLG